MTATAPSNTLSAPSLSLGLPLLAVAGAVLRKPFSQMAEKTYRVTGPWSDPQVQETGKVPTQAPAR